MDKRVFAYLRSYSYSVFKINRLLVSAYLHSNKILSLKNLLLRSLLIKASDDDYMHLLEFNKIQRITTLEQLIEAFEFVVSPIDKIVTGAIYTPKNIRKFIANEVLDKNEVAVNLSICDPACGCGGFLYTVAKMLRRKTQKPYKEIFNKFLYGLDIQEYSVERSKILLSLLALSQNEDLEEFQFNIFQGNALNFKWDRIIKTFKGFDIIIGNPPYVSSRNIDERSKKLLENWEVCKSGHPDLYIPFFELGMSSLKTDGYLGFITMNTFFKSLNGRALRKFFQKNSWEFIIIDFAGYQVFKSKSTYTCICLVKKTQSENILYRKVESGLLECLNANSFSLIKYKSLDSTKGWNLQNCDLISKIESIGSPLGTLYKSRNGIATLKNEVYIFNPIKEDRQYFYLQNGSVFPIEKNICKEIINPNKFIKQKSINAIKEKIIFPYYYEGGEIRLINEEKLIDKYPKAYSYLKTKKHALALRDKGKGKYEAWFAYGRNQSLEKIGNKLFFPHISPTVPSYVINSDQDLLFHNGMAIIDESVFELKFLKKLLSSRLFWFYIINSSKPYGSGYFSLSRNYIKNFGVYDFSRKEKEYIVKENNLKAVNKFIENAYGINFERNFNLKI